jgi:hypothetical protein
MCCPVQVEAFEMGWSLVRRSPTKYVNKIKKPQVWGQGPYKDFRATDDDDDDGGGDWNLQSCFSCQFEFEFEFIYIIKILSWLVPLDTEQVKGLHTFYGKTERIM